MSEKSPYAAYVSCLKGSAIEVFLGDANDGALEHIQTVDLMGKGLPLARSLDGRYLYASTFDDSGDSEVDRIETFEIHPQTRRLDRVSATVIDARMAHISVDRRGGFLLGASFPSSRIAVYPIGDRGTVQPYPTATMATPFRAHQMLTDYSNRYIYMPTLLSDTMMSLIFDERTGELAENTPPSIYRPQGSGPRHVAFHPNRRYVYLMNEKGGDVTAYRLDSKSGGLTEIMSASYVSDDLTEEPWGAQIHVSPDGNQLYAADRKGSTLAVFEVDQLGGQITRRHLIATGKNPRCHDITPNGKHLVLAALGDHHVELYDVSNVEMGPRKVQSLPTRDAPAWVEIIR